MCTEVGCAALPSTESDTYHGLVKPGWLTCTIDLHVLLFCVYINTDIVFFGESLPERFAKLAAQVGVLYCVSSVPTWC